MNAISCSYFFINLLGFYNLTLLYYFLFLKSMPNFSRVFLYNLAFIFARGGSIQDSLSNFDWYSKHVNINFSNLPIV
jgi:hypothetical protein